MKILQFPPGEFKPASRSLFSEGFFDAVLLAGICLCGLAVLLALFADPLPGGPIESGPPGHEVFSNGPWTGGNSGN